MDIAAALIFFAWTVILGMLGWSLATGWRRVLGNEGTLPIFGMLERRGLSLERLQASPEALYGAVRRCAMCPSRERCDDWLATRIDGPAPACPNADYFEGNSPGR